MKVISKKRNNDNMSDINHVAIIMDGNGRWGLKNLIHVSLVTKKELSLLKNY